ncbi:uncharacterized protein EV422DRAFT_37166 [Fimicolochytrium jonesii]|uniref:uncharacterized protein n=1 Tax=Fimicolochytrium jonesii TaxID=1396493 RepID=UPI0022FDDBE9|nr:uncharacterized protein EV422DRAFT_37166 [Fimicolochytrium jonesii]KAI8821306.1 hypothetical protein EV422DRAFT_37166 [Fimicolochytrium jonesii]
MDLPLAFGNRAVLHILNILRDEPKLHKRLSVPKSHYGVISKHYGELVGVNLDLNRMRYSYPPALPRAMRMCARHQRLAVLPILVTGVEAHHCVVLVVDFVARTAEVWDPAVLPGQVGFGAEGVIVRDLLIALGLGDFNYVPPTEAAPSGKGPQAFTNIAYGSDSLCVDWCALLIHLRLLNPKYSLHDITQELYANFGGPQELGRLIISYSKWVHSTVTQDDYDDFTKISPPLPDCIVHGVLPQVTRYLGSVEHEDSPHPLEENVKREWRLREENRAKYGMYEKFPQRERVGKENGGSGRNTEPSMEFMKSFLDARECEKENGGSGRNSQGGIASRAWKVSIVNVDSCGLSYLRHTCPMETPNVEQVKLGRRCQYRQKQEVLRVTLLAYGSSHTAAAKSPFICGFLV